MQKITTILCEFLKSCTPAGAKIFGREVFARHPLHRWRALAWLRFYKFDFTVRSFFSKYRTWIAWSALIALCLSTHYLAMHLGDWAAMSFSPKQQFDALRTLIVTVGAALLGSTAIAFSFVMFAMQTNIERMPHGLFRKFTGDARLMLSFALTFALAIMVPTLSLLPSASWAAIAISYSALGTILVFTLLIYSYRRALLLINPLRQLHFIITDTNRSLSRWGRRATRATPLLEMPAESVPASPFGSSHDLGRSTYFQLNPIWREAAFRALRYAISFSRRYAETGDYEVSAYSLDTVISINAIYISVKGKTFFSDNGLFENPLSHDNFISETLEALRQNAQIATSRADEQQLEQTFRALSKLVSAYANIDYSNLVVSKKHAQLAAVYLAEATQAAVPHNMADVAMHGVRLLGEAAKAILNATNKPTETASIVRRIGILGSAGALNEKLRALTIEAIRQLANITMAILKTKSNDSHFALQEIDESTTLIAEFFLNVPDTGMLHTTYLSPYFSGTSLDTFQKELTDLANAILAEPVDSTDAKAILDNIAEWSDGLYKNKKKLLLIAIQQKSHFCFDIIHWIANVSKLLIALTAAPACDDHTREELLGHALWLISVLSWIPDTKEETYFAENYKVSEALFDVAWEAYLREATKSDFEFNERMQSLLLDWGLRDATHATGRALLENAIYGCAALSIANGTELILKNVLQQKLAKLPSKDQKHLDRAAHNIRIRATSLRENPYTLSRIERAIETTDSRTSAPLLIELANIISPNTIDEKMATDTC